jgi:hypothetical protein
VQHARVACDVPTRLDDDRGARATEVPLQRPVDRRCVLVERRQRIDVLRRQAAAEVEHRQLDALASQLGEHGAGPLDCGLPLRRVALL